MTDGVIPLDEANRRLADEREPPIANTEDYGAVPPEPGQGRQDEGALVPAAGRRLAVPLGPKIEILSPLTWQDQPIPERRWLVPDLLLGFDLIAEDVELGNRLEAALKPEIWVMEAAE